MRHNILEWAFGGFMLPLFKAINKSQGEVTPKIILLISLYGYLVLCGIVFNVASLFAMISEMLK